MWQLLPSNIPIEGWMINPYIYGFLNSYGKVLWLPNHNTEVVNTGEVFCGVCIVINWKGALRSSLSLSPLTLADTLMYCSLHSTLLHLHLQIILLFYVMVSLSWGATRKYIMGLPPLKWTCIPSLLQMFLKFLLTLWYRVLLCGCYCPYCCCTCGYF